MTFTSDKWQKIMPPHDLIVHDHFDVIDAVFVIYVAGGSKAYFRVKIFQVMLRTDPDGAGTKYFSAVLYRKGHQFLTCTFFSYFFGRYNPSYRHFIIRYPGRHQPCISNKLFVVI